MRVSGSQIQAKLPPIMVVADGAGVIVAIIAKQRYVFALRHAGNTVFAELSILNT